MAKDWRKNPITLLLVGLLVGVAAWALHRILNQGAGDLLQHFFGIDNLYYQSGIVLVVIIVLVGGIFGVKKLKDVITG